MRKALLNQNIHIVEGNTKLSGGDDSFLIFNILSQVTCPHKTPICEFVCYAANEERRFSSVRKSRSDNTRETAKDTFVTDMINWIQYELSRPKFKGKTLYFRIHSAGDFYDKKYFEKWIDITNFFKGNNNIVFTAYTKSLPIIAWYLISSVNITLIYSIMPDTNPEDVEIAKAMGLKTFEAIPIGQSGEDFKCPGQCGTCKACYHKNNGIDSIYTEFHGSRAKAKKLNVMMSV